MIISEKIFTLLEEKGMSREQAYDLVQPKTARAWDEQVPFRPLLEEDPQITSVLSKEDLDDAFDYHYHLKHVDEIFERCGLN